MACGGGWTDDTDMRFFVRRIQYVNQSRGSIIRFCCWDFFFGLSENAESKSDITMLCFLFSPKTGVGGIFHPVDYIRSEIENEINQLLKKVMY